MHEIESQISYLEIPVIIIAYTVIVIIYSKSIHNKERGGLLYLVLCYNRMDSIFKSVVCHSLRCHHASAECM